jgi:hypothetical protein
MTVREYGTVAAYKRSALAFVITTFQPIIEITAEFFACEQIGAFGYLSTKHPNVRCYTAQWTASLGLFLPLSLYALAVPVWLFVLLRRARPSDDRHGDGHGDGDGDGAHAFDLAKRMDAVPGDLSGGPSATVRSAESSASPAASDRRIAARLSVSMPAHSLVYALLARHLRPRLYAWEVVALLQRLSLLLTFAVMSSAGADVWSQRFAYFCLIACFLCAHLYCRPHATARANELEALSLFGLTVIAAGLASQTASDELLNSLKGPLHTFLFVIGAAISTVLAAVTLWPIARATCQSLCSACPCADGSAADDKNKPMRRVSRV